MLLAKILAADHCIRSSVSSGLWFVFVSFLSSSAICLNLQKILVRVYFFHVVAVIPE